MDWQPIETAPKDGSYVLVWPPSRPGTVSVARWYQVDWMDAKYWLRTDSNRKIQPTHWAPIPPGPGKKALPKPTYGCHCDLELGEKPGGCVIDQGRPEDCLYAKHLLKEKKGKKDCDYWQPIKVKK